MVNTFFTEVLKRDPLKRLAPRCFQWVKMRYRGIIRKSGNQEKKGWNAGYQPPRG
jgi:hypothetical protein